MKSIKTKFFLGYLAIIFLIIILFIAFNSIFFKQYLLYSDNKEFNEIYKQIENNIFLTNVDDYLKEISYKKAVQIDIVDIKTRRTVFTSGYKHRSLFVFDYENLDIKDKKIYKSRTIPTKTGEVLVKFKELASSYLVVLFKPIELIDERVYSNNTFILIVGGVLLAIGSFIINILVKKQVEPILKLQKQTLNISNLIFSDKFETKSKDEIAHLGHNVNKISFKLSQAITDLELDINKLEKANRNTKRFIASISHEFKTPLGIIKGYTESLRYNLVKEDKKEEYLDVILAEVDRLTSFVKDLIGIIKKENEKYKRVNSLVDISELTQNVINRHKNLNDEYIVNLKGYSNHKVIGIKSEIIQIFDNFISNAKRYSTDKVIEIEIKEEKEYINIYIKNKGVQIPQDKSIDIWESFYKLDDSRQRTAGTGLGLFINRTLILLMDGIYGYNNTEDGVEFYFGLRKG